MIMGNLPRAENALDILLSALPSNVATNFVSSISTPLSTTSSISSQLPQQTTTPTSASRTTSILSSTSSISRTTLYTIISPTQSLPSSSISSSSRSSHSGSTSTSLPTTSSDSSISNPTSQMKLSQGAIAALTIGIVTAFVVILLFTLFLTRHCRQGRPWLTSSPKPTKGSFPEIAHLYDPDHSPRSGITRIKNVARRGNKRDTFGNKWSERQASVRRTKDGPKVTTTESQGMGVEVPRPLFFNSKRHLNRRDYDAAYGFH